MKPMDKDKRARVLDNLFTASHRSVEPWDEFRWHVGRGGECDTDSPNSSQALAIDVFGTLSLLDERNQIFDALTRRQGLASTGEWSVELEFPVPNSLLGEPRETQVDAVAQSQDYLVFMECKFTEPGGGRCSQPEPLRKGAHAGMRQCSGSYEPQTNPTNQKRSFCALTAKGISYWEHIPALFGIDASERHSPCPFAGSSYQWMRNIVACAALAEDVGKTPAFLVVYADAPGGRSLPTAEFVRSDEWSELKSSVRDGTVRVGEISYLDLVDLALDCADESADTLRELRDWVERKIRRQTGET